LPDPARVVEIGTGWGTSLLRILYGLSLHEDAHVKTVDLLECPKAKEHLSEAQIPYWRYTMVKMDSIEAAVEHTEPLDMLYVDGSHSYEGVKADIEAWSGFIKPGKPGGLLIFDDYDNDMHEVTPAVNELVMSDGDMWNYIGCVRHLVVFERRHDLEETTELHQEE
jgi:predicted O-methyltransferase YrrM